jgi:replication factor C large subunit
MTDWTEKYRPSTLAEVRGNDKARDALREWAERWDDHREAVVLHGSPGIGKTSAAHALAADMGWAVVELNASDQRTADVIERFAGRAAKNATLDGAAGRTADAGASAADAGRQLVILDEADNIHGNYDRGGAAAITQLVKESSQPIVLIANDYYEISRGLRNATREIEFRDVSARSIVPVLRDICRKEGIEFDPDALQQLAETNSGDLRGAINDLQAVAQQDKQLTVEDLATGGRDRTIGIFEFLDAVLKEESAEEALYAAYDVDETPDDLVKWVEDNLPKVYEGAELARAYDHLANADRWIGRVRATQNYSYWRYATDNLAAGVAAARDDTKGGWTRFGRPQFWRSTDETTAELAQRIATHSGVSMSTARREILPYLSAMTHHCKPRGLTVLMAARYDLDEQGVAFVTGSGESTNKVQSIVEDAQTMREKLLEEHAGGAFAARTDVDSQAESGGDDGTAAAEAVAGDEGDAAADDEENTDGESGGDDTEQQDAEDDDREADPETVADDDQQSGLADFM